MREKYETLAIKDLRAIAKIRGVKGASSMSKGQVIEVLLLLDETEEKAKLAAEADDAIRAEEAKRAVLSRTKKSSDEGDSEPAKKPRGRKPAAKAEETAEKPATEAKPATDAKPAERPQDDRAKALIDEAFERQARLNPDKTPEELKAAYYEKKQREEEERNIDSGIPAHGILEIMPDGFGFIRCENFLPGENDVYVAPGIIRKYGLRTGDIIKGSTKVKTQNEKFSALLSLTLVNGFDPETISKRVSFENMTPIFPDNRIRLETPGSTVAMRVMDLLSPVGKGQRGMIVSPPKAGKTTLLKEVAKSVKRNNPEIHLIILLIDERPEEVTDIKEAIEGPNVEVIYSTFDELPEHHKRVSEMVIERAKRLVEHHKDVMILLDSITRLTRAYNLTVPPSGRTLSGGLDPAALHMPKRFFGAARNMREGGSLTILATALVETGSKMDDVVYEEFKGTGNMEMVLDRKLSEKRIFPAIDIAKSGTRRDDLLLTKEEIDAVNMLRKGINGLKPEESVDRILDMFAKTRGNNDFIHMVNKIQLF
ncbi:MAG: transcription termination factor Rho [Lachnospiraceae bacterium]|nr:transcription termination factor Rho [Lachnospiraceae bacterium]